MSLVAINTPIRTVSSIQSRAISSSQVRYTYTRKDGTFTTVAKTAGNKLILDNWTLEASVAVGDSIYVKFDDGTLEAEGTITALLSTPLRIETDIDYSSAATAKAGFANDFTLRPNYRVKVTIAEYPDFSTYVTSGEGGLVVIELGKAIKDIIDSLAVFYSEITISKLEIWDGSAESPTAETLILVTRSIRSIMATNGANLWDYLLQSVAPGQLLTKFPNAELTQWAGWRRTAWTVVDPDIGTRLTNAIEWVQRNAARDFTPGGLLGTNGILKTPYRIAGRVLLDTVTDYYNMVYVRDDVTLAALSEDYFYRYVSECINPIGVQWINSLGGYEEQVFELDQVFEMEADSGQIYSRGINDYLENIDSLKSRLSSGFTQRITLQADKLTRGQLLALQEITYSPEVKVFLAKDGSAMVEAVVFAGYSDTFNTRGTLFEFTINLELPFNFDLLANLQYTL